MTPASSSWLPSLTTNALAFGAASFASSVLCTLFSLYVTPVFTSVYKIDDRHFYASHVVFAIWNAINDPAFAWLIDNTTASGGDRRLPAIKYGGPLWCLAFLIPWWPWSTEPGSFLVGLHFCVSICMFDSFLTYVLLVHCALLADLTTDNTLRNNYNNVGSLLGVAGGAAGAVSYYLYDGKDMAPFQSFCLGAAAVSCLGFWWTGTRLDLERLDTFRREVPEQDPLLETTPPASITHTAPLDSGTKPNSRSNQGAGGGMRSRTPTRDSRPAAGSGGGEGEAAAAAAGRGASQLGNAPLSPKTTTGGAVARGGRELSFWGFTKQLSSHGNFWLYVSMNFMENFNALFDQSFFVFLDTKLFERVVPRGPHGVLTALCLYAPKLMTQVLTPVADRYGTYKLIMGAALFKLVAGVLMFACGRRAWPLWTLLFLGNRLAATAWGFYNLSFSDVIDEDTLRNKRPESMSVSVHGLQALFVKPAQSLAPMVGMAFLPAGALKTDLVDMTVRQAEGVQAAAFTLMWAVPAGCGLVQVLIWRAYRLHGTALKDMKMKLKGWERFLSYKRDDSTGVGMA
ncbi:unnamed protein product [Ectocarpus sp. 12 AP-2014]